MVKSSYCMNLLRVELEQMYYGGEGQIVGGKTKFPGAKLIAKSYRSTQYTVPYTCPLIKKIKIQDFIPSTGEVPTSRFSWLGSGK